MLRNFENLTTGGVSRRAQIHGVSQSVSAIPNSNVFSTATLYYVFLVTEHSEVPGCGGLQHCCVLCHENPSTDSKVI
jgi:hypothetical protein